jgi:hypothetical protein
MGAAALAVGVSEKSSFHPARADFMRPVVEVLRVPTRQSLLSVSRRTFMLDLMTLQLFFL